MNQKTIGNILIMCALALFSYTAYPVLLLFLFPPTLDKDPRGFVVQIPKIHAQAHIVPNVDPWNQYLYDKALDSGVAQAAHTALPNQKGTMFLFAHSSNVPWNITRQNTAFLRLGELDRGDVITIFYKSRKYPYTVTSKKEIWPDQTQYLKNSQGDVLVLQTCTPIGTSLKRLLVFAKRT